MKTLPKLSRSGLPPGTPPRRKVCATVFRRASITLCCLLMALPASARDLFGIPLPPPPHQVVRELRAKIHRVAGEVKSAGRRAAAEVAHDDDDDDRNHHTSRARRSVRPAPPISRSSPAVREEYRELDREIEMSRSAPERSTTRPQRELNQAEADRAPGSAHAFPRSSTDRRPDAPQETGEMTGTAPMSERSSTASKQPKATGDSKVEFGRPVPGKRGMVYPPGAEESSENMIDVEGFEPGQIVRDPRTGALFRVP